MAYVDIDPGDLSQVIITAAFREKDLVKAIPGARWNRQRSVWHAPLSWGVAWALRGVFKTDLEIGPALQAWSGLEYTHRVAPAMALREARDADLAVEWQSRLYGFQRAGVSFLTMAKRALLADEMGTGKTVQAISALRLLRDQGEQIFPALVVAPNSMKRTWLRELATWLPDARVQIADSGASTRRKAIKAVMDGDADILVINWESLRSHSRLAPYGSVALTRCEVCQPGTSTGKQSACEHCAKELNEIGWRSVIADEAHRMKNPKAKQTRALWWLGQAASFKFALTGTPIANRPDDLWSLMHFIAPEDWPTKSEFIDRYCLHSWNTWGGLDIVGIRYDTRDEFYNILDPRFVRRTKAVVLPDLPPKVHTTRYVDLAPKQRRAYEDLRKTMLAELQGGLVAVTQPLVRARRLLQLTSAYQTEEWVAALPSAKLDALLEIIEEAGDQRLVVFAESRKLIQLAEQVLERASVRYASIHGEIIPAERELAVQRLETGEIQVLLATLGTGGEGLTLTAASTVVYLERSFSMIQNQQSEDRLHRIGQAAAHVDVIDLIATGTIDELRLEALSGKLVKLEEIVRDEEALRRFLEKETVTT